MGAKAADKDAFDAIYESNVEEVYETALRYSHNHHTAEEITQTVFLKLYMNLGHVKREAISAWLLTTAKNMALNDNRKRKREILDDEILREESWISAECSSEQEFMKRLCAEEYRELTENIFADLYSLNPRWYEAVTITYLLEKPQKEVAEVMGINIETLHSMLYRAKKWIKKNYREQYDHLRKQ